MSNSLILNFPVLKNKKGDFLDKISYSVIADHSIFNNKLEIKHILTGKSFIRQLVESKKAIFSASLYFKDSAVRQNFICNNFINENGDIIAEQSIPIEFSYAPDITPNIIILEDHEITVNENSGLTDFWNSGEILKITEYSRIASCGTLNFTRGNASKLISPIYNDKLKDGEIKVEVAADAGEKDKAIIVECGKGVFDVLKKTSVATKNDPQDAKDGFKLAITTQILCGAYGIIKSTKEEDVTNGGLLLHLDELCDKTGEDWKSEEFNPSLAATKMWPYMTDLINEGGDNE